MKPAIVGIAGPALTVEEAELLRACPPAGVILFGRNILDPEQLADLVGALRAILPAKAVLMVDQEGGRVARLRPPYWRGHPPARAFGFLFERDPGLGLRAAWLGGAVIGAEAATAGFDVVAAPVLDRSVPGAHDVIGDRAFSADPRAVAELGRAFAEGLLAAGVQPVGKHAPGHGRARADSHHNLPVVEGPPAEAEADLLPFALNSGLPWLMSAHILYPGWDAERPATLSATVIEEIVRRRIGFDGLLISDDLAMGALSGALAERACHALRAGCDIALYCAGDFAANKAVLAACPELTPQGALRLEAAWTVAAGRRIALDLPLLADERDKLLG
jgi:beta-N-acetylhexosaminidase